MSGAPDDPESGDVQGAPHGTVPNHLGGARADTSSPTGPGGPTTPAAPARPRGGLSRRQFMGLGGLGALTLGLGGVGGFQLARGVGEGIDADLMSRSYPFRGEHQQGVLTPAQQQMHTAAFDLTTDDRDEVIQLLTDWTLAAERMTRAEPVGDPSVDTQAPPLDTGEAGGLGAAGLTISFGVGASLFLDEGGADRFGLADRLPVALRDGIPTMAAEKLDPARGGGDLVVQACSEDPMVNLHALHNLTRVAFGRATMRWTQLGYGRTSSTSTSQQTPRNLFGFKDGTSNIKAEDPPEVLRDHLWIQPGDDQGAWASGGTYMCFRKIKMMVEVWDELALGEQQRVIGRDKLAGAPLSGGEEFTSRTSRSRVRGRPSSTPPHRWRSCTHRTTRVGACCDVATTTWRVWTTRDVWMRGCSSWPSCAIPLRDSSPSSAG